MKALPLLLTLCCSLASAQGAYRWVDQDGKVHYGDRPPAGKSVQAQAVKLTAPEADKTLPYATREAMRDFPVTLYVTETCGAGCKEGRELLRRRGIPFTEKTISTPEDGAALGKLVGSEQVSVPVLLVGDNPLKGFLATEWSILLDAAGYPKEAGR